MTLDPTTPPSARAARYVVIGAGAIGATVGAQLQRGGRDVVLVARGEHAAAMRDQGLELHTPDGVERIAVRVARLSDYRPEPSDVVILCVKSHHTEGILAELAAQYVDHVPVGQRLPLVCLQNGIENERRARRYFNTVVGGCLMMPAVLVRPGRVAASGAPLLGIIDLGLIGSAHHPVIDQLAQDLRTVRFDSTVRTDIMRWKRAKLIRNLDNALDALGRPPEDEDLVGRRVSQAVRNEARRVFAALHLDVVDDDAWARYRGDRVVAAHMTVTDGASTSTWQSLARGTGSTEIDFLNGEISMLGREAGVPTPVNDALRDLVRRLARRGRKPDARTYARARRQLRQTVDDP